MPRARPNDSAPRRINLPEIPASLAILTISIACRSALLGLVHRHHPIGPGQVCDPEQEKSQDDDDAASVRCRTLGSRKALASLLTLSPLVRPHATARRSSQSVRTPADWRIVGLLAGYDRLRLTRRTTPIDMARSVRDERKKLRYSIEFLSPMHRDKTSEGLSARNQEVTEASGFAERRSCGGCIGRAARGRASAGKWHSTLGIADLQVAGPLRTVRSRALK